MSMGGRLLTEQEIKAWSAWVLARTLKHELSDRFCRCSHPEGEHVIAFARNGDAVVLECAVDRRDGGPECGCEKFVEAGRGGDR
jgi:hypothetical protein